MFRFIALAAIVLVGACAGALVGLVGGAAVLESGRNACDMQTCADTIVRSIAPAGAVIGAFLGFGKAKSLARRREP